MVPGVEGSEDFARLPNGQVRLIHIRGGHLLQRGAEVSFDKGALCLDEGPKVSDEGPKCIFQYMSRRVRNGSIW